MNAEPKHDAKEENAKHEAAKSPDKDDVHEQREAEPSVEGVVEEKRPA